MVSTRFLLPAVCLFLQYSLAGQVAPARSRPLYDSSRTENIYYRIQAITRYKPDSAIAVLGYGKANGLFKAATGVLMTTREAGKGTNRAAAENMANAEIISITDTSAIARISVYARYQNEQFYPGDLLKLETWSPPGLSRNIFYELAKLDILFLDNARQPMITKKEILENSDPDFDHQLAQRYADEIRSFKDMLLNFADERFTRIHPSGPFKGKTMIDGFGMATWYDLLSYFHYVRKYPGNFMGNAWKINETFGTWLINFAPQAERNREWLLPLIEAGKNEDLEDLLQKAAFYIRSDTLSQWTERVFELQNSGLPADAMRLCNKLIYLSRKLKDEPAEYAFYYTRSVLADAAGDTRNALADAEAAHRGDRKNVYYTQQLAGLYGKTEQFADCYRLYKELLNELPGNTNITGNYGWYLLSGGHIEEAVPYCRAAYSGDTSSMAFSLNYAHTFLLRNSPDSARLYYQRSLDNLIYPSDYTAGPRADFDFFFKKGWNRKAVAETADWMDQAFEEKYKALTRGNEIWDIARKKYEQKNYPAAIAAWKEYISLFNNSKEPPVRFIHNALNWTGLSYYYAKRYDSAAFYYKLALQLAIDKLSPARNPYDDPENDYILGDYDRIYHLYTLTGKPGKAEQYKSLYNAELQKLKELFTHPLLHVISLGGRSRNPEYNSVKNSTAFYESLTGLDKEAAAKAKNILINGEGLTREKLTSLIDEVRKASKPEDIFVFYYAGEYSNRGEQHFLDFNPADSMNGRIPLAELMDHIDLVYATKKLLITDLPNPSLASLVATKYISTGNNAGEMIFLGPGIETPLQENGLSLFTDQLTNTVKELKQKGSFTARDLVDKAGYRIGRGQHYLPVLSFTNSKDFVVYDQPGKETDNPATRGLIVKENASGNADPAGNATQKNYALLFASDHYLDPGFNKLANPIYDASALEALLKNDFGFEVKLVKNPSGEEIEKWLSEYRDNKNYGPNDQLLVFFAGHGIYYDKAKMGYLVAHDSRINDPAHKTYLSYSDLGNIYLKNINCNRIFLVLDACFAGSFFDNNAVRGTPQIDAKNLVNLIRNASNKRFYKGISSGAKQYVEDGKPGQHSPFAGSFMNVLFNKSLQKGFVTADEIIGEIKSNPPASTAVCEGNFNYSDPLSHFIFRLTTAEKTSDIKQDNLKRDRDPPSAGNKD
ncbi:MAG: caspase family protein [Sphingobacteriales bacterium]|nr:caspase family protein [Sphingobacteriales bacterium]